MGKPREQTGKETTATQRVIAAGLIGIVTATPITEILPTIGEIAKLATPVAFPVEKSN